MRMLHAWTAVGALAACLGSAPPAAAQAKTEISLARFFGACEADFGTVADVSKGRGECGIITTLINKYNAENKDGVVVKPQVIEWAGYYDQISARIVARDVPTIAVMHTAVLGDFVNRRLVEPLDADFKAAGIDTADFTPAVRSVLYEGKPYALPWDTAAMLWHINMGLMKQAGLVGADGEPLLPKSVDELFAQAAQFKDKTGKPYFVLATSPDKASNARVFYTLLHQQDGKLFPADGNLDKASFQSPEVRRVYETLKRLYDEGHIIRNTNYSSSVAGFLNGGGGVFMNGTWVIDSFLDNQAKPDSKLKDGYEVRIFPSLFKAPSVWIDSHTWVLLRGGTPTPAVRKAAQSFLKFMWDNNGEWARTGHLAARQSVVTSASFRSLPHRSDIEDVARIGRTALPQGTKRAFGIQDVIGEEMAAMFASGKPVDDVIRDTERRVNELLSRR